EHVGPGPGRRPTRLCRPGAAAQDPVRPGGPVGGRSAGPGVGNGRGPGRREGAADGTGHPGTGAGPGGQPGVGGGRGAGGGPGAAAGRVVEARLPAVERPGRHPGGRVRPGAQGPPPGGGVPPAGQGGGRAGRLPSPHLGRWHHHQALSLIAVWFLTREARRGKKADPGPDGPGGPAGHRSGAAPGGRVRPPGPGPADDGAVAAAERGGEVLPLEAAEPLAPTTAWAGGGWEPVELVTSTTASAGPASTRLR